MLMDILGIVIAFVTVMLLFSMLVTSLVQVIQSLLCYRYGNLNQGLKMLTISLYPNEVDAKWLILKRHLSTTPGLLANPTWVTKAAIEDTFKILDDFDDSDKEKLETLFPRFEQYMTHRFNTIMTNTTLIVSFLVAFSFQLSTPDLLNKLSTNKELREQLIAYSSQKVSSAESLELGTTYREVVNESIHELINENEKYAFALEEISGESQGRKAMLDDLSLILEDKPEIRATLLKDFDEILKVKLKKSTLSNQELLSENISDIAMFDFKVFPGGGAYYMDYKNNNILNNWFGVFITVFLLALGAPFWFDRLKELSNLRDKISEMAKKDS